MSHKVHPYAHRLLVVRPWKSRWFKDKKDYVNYLACDLTIREFIAKKLRNSFVSTVDFDRNDKKYRIIIRSSRPGMILGEEGRGVTALVASIKKELSRKRLTVSQEIVVDVVEVREPDGDAMIVALSIVEMLQKRMQFKRVLKMTAERVMMQPKVKGIRIAMSGCLGGADMARKEEVKKGGIPLQFIRADIDYATIAAHMPYGAIGIKVWINKGDTLPAFKMTKKISN